MPTWNGLNFFGPCPIFDHDDPPNIEQINHYPGVRGVERLDLGLGIATTLVRGILCGVNDADLGSVLVTIRQAKLSGIAGTLVDTDNLTWPDAVLHTFRTVGRRTFSPGWGITREYEMTFLHTGYNPNVS